MRSRHRIVAFGAAGAMVLAGIACAIVFGGLLGPVLAFILIAGGLVLATSLVFLEVGLSEDLERERDLERSRALKRGRAPSRRAARTVRLPRLRGQRRHLR